MYICIELITGIGKRSNLKFSCSFSLSNLHFCIGWAELKLYQFIPKVTQEINLCGVFFPFLSLLQEGRKIQVGDCALFKPPKESPPFIGIIRSLTLDAEDTLSLGVNWLYRPADIRLPKGPSLEAAPNEVFYSFHKDEILAASLLHPCKVAFLCKGIELPQGISSFVCRRVYDIDNKCLWWLTDKDYINVSAYILI